MFSLRLFWQWTSRVTRNVGRGRLCLDDALTDTVTLSDAQLGAVALDDEVPQCD